MVGLGLRATQVAAVFGSVLVLTLAQLNIPSRHFWDAKPAVLVFVAIVAGLIAVAEILGTILGETQAYKVRGYEREIRAILSSVLALSQNELTCSWQSVGVHAFLVRRPNGVTRRLVNIGGIRMGATPSMTFPKWTVRKGVIGRAFSLGALVAIDWGHFADGALAQGRAAWNAKSDQDRYSMSWGELFLSSQYFGIVAFPIFGFGDEPLGVIAVDAPVAAVSLDTPSIESILRDAARSVSELGKPPKSWWNYHA